MKQNILLTAALMGLGLVASAQSVTITEQETGKKDIVPGVSVENLKMEYFGNYMAVDMTMDLSDLKVEGNRAVLLTPWLVNGADSLDLPSVVVYGRRRYYYYVRNYGETMLSGADELGYRATKKPDSIDYHNILPYAGWMDGATLSLHRSDYGCCNSIVDEEDGLLGRHSLKFFPDLVYVKPKAQMSKSRSLEGSAYIEFPVDRTEIYPEYRNNKAEFAKIRATIDSVRSDADVTITSVWLKGYASPESPYAHNKDLAVGRTAAIKTYIGQLYDFNEKIIETDYEPEDWAGLRKYVENSKLEHRSEILEIIDSNLDPDPKEKKIKTTYPAEYRYLLTNCYPALRHTDYRIAYEIRSFSDVEEIKRIFAESPQKLNLNEFYIVAQAYEPGTEEFTEVFETAVRLYPEDETANLNAANAEMRKGNNNMAEKYLENAGESAEAVYARGALALRKTEYAKAVEYFNAAAAMGLGQATVTLNQMKDRGLVK